MTSKRTGSRKYGKYILISFLIGLVPGGAVLILSTPHIHRLLWKENGNMGHFELKTTPQNTKGKGQSDKFPVPKRDITTDDELHLTKLLSENTKLMEKTDQMLEELAKLLPTNENLPLEIISKETYLNEEKTEQIVKQLLTAIWQYRLPPADDNTLKIDSLLLGNRIEKERDILIVEFWSSPLNYSGYRYQSSHLILFGIPDKENIFFYYKDKKLSFTYGTDTIYIEDTDDFISVNYHKNLSN